MGELAMLCILQTPDAAIAEMGEVVRYQLPQRMGAKIVILRNMGKKIGGAKITAPSNEILRGAYP